MQMQLFARLSLTALMVAIAAVGYQPAIEASILEQTVSSVVSSSSVSSSQSQTTPGQLVAQAATGAPFIGDAHAAAGSAQIVDIDGSLYLEFDDAFRSDDGPDLFVLLHKEAVPTGYDAEDYVNLGRLQATEGTQRYAIPEGVDINALQSAVIWCQQFDVTFAYATL